MIERWAARMGAEAWERWRASGWLETPDYARGGTARVDYGFAEDGAVVDAAGDGWPDVRVPTLIVHGRRDDVASIALSRDWAAGKRHVRLVEVDDGHELGASVTQITVESERFLSGFLNGTP
jgi:pimeloyl-ACP methyl ester carboxylesterase